jgi:hypothetical protein
MLDSKEKHFCQGKWLSFFSTQLPDGKFTPLCHFHPMRKRHNSLILLNFYKSQTSKKSYSVWKPHLLLLSSNVRLLKKKSTSLNMACYFVEGRPFCPGSDLCSHYWILISWNFNHFTAHI